MYRYPCPDKDVLLETLDDKILIKQISMKRVPEFTRFVFGQYKLRFSGETRWHGSPGDLMKMIRHEVRYARQGIFIVAETIAGEILAGLRGLRYVPGTVFTSEEVFGISPDDVAGKFGVQTSRLWHGNQLSLDQLKLRISGGGVQSRFLVKQLFVHLLSAIIHYDGCLMLAETDQAAERWYATYGLPWQPLTDYQPNIGWDRASALHLDAVLASPRFRSVFADSALAALR